MVLVALVVDGGMGHCVGLDRGVVVGGKLDGVLVVLVIDMGMVRCVGFDRGKSRKMGRKRGGLGEKFRG